MKAFSAALDSLGNGPFSIGQLEPTPGLVNEYYNDSTAEGQIGNDGLGSWIGQNGLHVVEWPKNLETNRHSKNGDNLRTKKAAKTGSR
jgi:Mn-containing catalase